MKPTPTDLSNKLDGILQTDDNLMDVSLPMDDAFLMSRSKLKTELTTYIQDCVERSVVEELETVYDNINTGNVYLALGKIKERINQLRGVTEDKK